VFHFLNLFVSLCNCTWLLFSLTFTTVDFFFYNCRFQVVFPFYNCAFFSFLYFLTTEYLLISFISKVLFFILFSIILREIKGSYAPTVLPGHFGDGPVIFELCCHACGHRPRSTCHSLSGLSLCGMNVVHVWSCDRCVEILSLRAGSSSMSAGPSVRAFNRFDRTGPPVSGASNSHATT